MKFMKASFLVCFLVLWLFTANAKKSTIVFKAGFSEKDITPDIGMEADPGFVQHLKHQIVEAVLQDNANCTDAKLAVGIGHEDKVTFNRRLHMKNGLTYTHPRPWNPNIIDYAGPIDSDVGTIGVWDMDDNLLGVVVNFACHATTNPGGISASWIATMENTLCGATGNEALPVVFLQGASGDITQADNIAPELDYIQRFFL